MSALRVKSETAKGMMMAIAALLANRSAAASTQLLSRPREIAMSLSLTFQPPRRSTVSRQQPSSGNDTIPISARYKRAFSHAGTEQAERSRFKSVPA
jgi:hypothetical protein